MIGDDRPRLSLMHVSHSNNHANNQVTALGTIVEDMPSSFLQRARNSILLSLSPIPQQQIQAHELKRITARASAVEDEKQPQRPAMLILDVDSQPQPDVRIDVGTGLGLPANTSRVPLNSPSFASATATTSKFSSPSHSTELPGTVGETPSPFGPELQSPNNYLHSQLLTPLSSPARNRERTAQSGKPLKLVSDWGSWGPAVNINKVVMPFASAALSKDSSPANSPTAIHRRLGSVGSARGDGNQAVPECLLRRVLRQVKTLCPLRPSIDYPQLIILDNQTAFMETYNDARFRQCFPSFAIRREREHQLPPDSDASRQAAAVAALEYLRYHLESSSVPGRYVRVRPNKDPLDEGWIFQTGVSFDVKDLVIRRSLADAGLA